MKRKALLREIEQLRERLHDQTRNFKLVCAQRDEALLRTAKARQERNKLAERLRAIRQALTGMLDYE